MRTRTPLAAVWFRMERPALFVGDAEEGAATLNEDEVRLVMFFPYPLGRASCGRLTFKVWS